MNRSIFLHGGALDQMADRFPDAPLPWLDLSTGINPWPYPYSANAAESMRHLPTASQFADCTSAMAKCWAARADQLLLAPGSELLIRWLPTLLTAKRVCVAVESYADHANSWRSAGVTLTEAADPLAEIDRTDIVVICNPNNPDGRRWSVPQLASARQQLAARQGWLIIDEAYMDLTPEHSMLGGNCDDGLIVLRSFGKFFGLAGARLGAMFAPASVLETVQQRLGVWPVSGPALAIATEAYLDSTWQQETRSRLLAARQELDVVLEKHGFAVIGGTDLFRFVRAPDAARVWEALGRHGIYVRRFEWSNDCLRIGLPENNAALIRLDAALGAINPLT